MQEQAQRPKKFYLSILLEYITNFLHKMNLEYNTFKANI